MPTLRDVSNFLGLTSELQMAAKLKVKAPVSTLALIKAYEYVPPRAAFKQDKTQGAQPIAVQFTDESAGYIRKREWKFGDGGTDHVANPLHTYEHADCNNQYPITLTVSNDGGSDTAKSSMWVYPKPPKARFAAGPWSGPSPLQVTFLDDSDAECIMSRLWDFGDGGTDTGVTPTHVFHNNTGNTVEFRVSLEIQVESNSPAYYAANITVTPGAGAPPPAPPVKPYITAARVPGMDAIVVNGSHFTNGVKVRLDVTYPPGHTASYWSDPVAGGEFSTTISEVTCTGNAGKPCTVKATMDGTTFYSAKDPVQC
jgi:hypothetical protein